MTEPGSSVLAKSTEDSMYNPSLLDEHAAGAPVAIRPGIAERLDIAQILNRSFAGSAPRKLAQGQRLWSEGEERSHVYLVRSGALCFSRMLPDGRRVVIGFAYAGDLIGLGFDRHICDADSIQCCKLEALSNIAFQRVVHADQAFADLVRSEIGHALSEAQEHVVVVSKLTAAERIAHFLVTLSNRNRRHGNSPASVVLPMRRVDIADFLGLTIETVSRTLTSFRKASFIEMEQPSVVFLRGLNNLSRLASGNSDENARFRQAA
jgi:CRP/FNR family transcriptional regulator, anaerobic regulatory protein